MHDQAESLRKHLQSMRNSRQTKVLAIVSGKGGVGKSNFSLNFSISLSQQKARVLLIDLDVGMGNIGILIGQSSLYTIADHFTNDIPIKQMITKGPGEIEYIAGGTGLSELFTMTESQFEKFSYEFQTVLEDYDYIILDMGAGVTEQSLQFIRSADELFIITTPEPTAITDAYSIMKFLAAHASFPYFLICNKSGSNLEGRETLKRLKGAARQFLGKETITLGVLPDDKVVQKAVIRQIPFTIMAPSSKVSVAMQNLLDTYLDDYDYHTSSQKKARIPFMKKMKQYFFERQGGLGDE